MPDFAARCALHPDADGRLLGAVSPGWAQGRGAYGGLVTALLARAVEAAADVQSRPIRSLTAELFGAVAPGPVWLRPELLRAGSGLSTVATRLGQGEELLAHAVANLGKTRALTPDWVELSPPALPPWEDLPPLEMGPPMAPEFTQQLEYRTAGPAPFTGETPSLGEGWVRLRSPGPKADVAWVCAHIDAWWPGMLRRFDRPRPSATVTFTLEVLASLEGLDPAAPLYLRCHTVAQSQGWAVEFRELWTQQGALVALNQQTMALLG
jgi:acyl-CoA thioesterase